MANKKSRKPKYIDILKLVKGENIEQIKEDINMLHIVYGIAHSILPNIKACIESTQVVVINGVDRALRAFDNSTLRVLKKTNEGDTFDENVDYCIDLLNVAINAAKHGKEKELNKLINDFNKTLND